MSDFKGKQKSGKLEILHILVRFLFKSDSMSNNSCIFAPEWQNRRYSRIEHRHEQVGIAANQCKDIWQK